MNTRNSSRMESDSSNFSNSNTGWKKTNKPVSPFRCNALHKFLTGNNRKGRRHTMPKEHTNSAGLTNSGASTSDSSTTSSFYSADSDDGSEIYAVSLGWRKTLPFHPPGWKLVVRPRSGTVPHPLDPRGRNPIPIHQRVDPRLKPKCRKEPLLIPLDRSKK